MQTVWQAQHAVDMEIALLQEHAIVTLHTMETLLVVHAPQTTTITLTAYVCPFHFKFQITHFLL
jgi:hypothetical protein